MMHSQERWQKMTLAEQMGNIGSEVSRATSALGVNEQRFWNSVTRALELFDLTLIDIRWRKRRLEIARARDVFCDAVLGGKEFSSDLKSLQPYYDQLAILSLKQSHA